MKYLRGFVFIVILILTSVSLVSSYASCGSMVIGNTCGGALGGNLGSMSSSSCINACEIAGWTTCCEYDEYDGICYWYYSGGYGSGDIDFSATLCSPNCIGSGMDGDYCPSGVCAGDTCDINEVARSGTTYESDCYGSTARYDSTPWECDSDVTEGSFIVNGVCSYSTGTQSTSTVNCDGSEVAYASPYMRSDCYYADYSGTSVSACDTSTSTGVYSANGFCARSSTSAPSTLNINCYASGTASCYDGVSQIYVGLSNCLDVRACDSNGGTTFTQDGIVCSGSCVGTASSDCCDDSQCNSGEYCNNYVCTDSCGLVATNNVFKIQDVSGRELMRVDINGDVAFSSDILTGQTSFSTGSADFLIDNSATGNYNFQAAIDVGDYDDILLRGLIYESQGSISYTSSQNFVIKNSVGTTVLKIDPNGNLYTTGRYGEWCDCQAGTYNDPRGLSGNRILNIAGDYSDSGYCQIVRGCSGATTSSSVTNDATSCRCNKDWGCNVESCSSSASYSRYSSITCA